MDSPLLPRTYPHKSAHPVNGRCNMAATNAAYFQVFPVAARHALRQTSITRSSARETGDGHVQRQAGDGFRRIGLCDDHPSGRAVPLWRPGLSTMTPLWSELALARATRSNAVADDVTDQSESAATRDSNESDRRGLQPVPRHSRPGSGLTGSTTSLTPSVSAIVSSASAPSASSNL